MVLEDIEMESGEMEPMTDAELAAILRKWEVAPAPASLEARVFGRRTMPRQRWRWPIGLAAAGLVGLGLWAVHERRPA